MGRVIIVMNIISISHSKAMKVVHTGMRTYVLYAMSLTHCTSLRLEFEGTKQADNLSSPNYVHTVAHHNLVHMYN